MALTAEQVGFFRHNGFLRLPTRLSDEHVERLRAAIWKDITDEVEPVVRRNGRVVRLSAIWDRGTVFRETITCDEILEPLVSLLGPNIEFVRNRHNHATLRLRDDGSPYLHRDVLQWSRTIATVIVYLEATSLDNGCTHVIPGTHLLPGLSDFSVLKDERAPASLVEQMVPLPMPAGGLVALDSMVFHTVGENRTDGTRMSMTLGYHSADELAGFDNPKRVLVRGERVYRGND
jgi:ectoine hydroxylase-related dioxygenase (phytanoyl-CoA dioxygenase family)